MTDTQPRPDWPDSDMLEAAWGIIANAWGGNWDAADEWAGNSDWREAAERWRDAYIDTITDETELRVDLINYLEQAQILLGKVSIKGASLLMSMGGRLLSRLEALNTPGTGVAEVELLDDDALEAVMDDFDGALSGAE